MKEAESSKCLKCGGDLSHGYILGKHSRIRWSSTREGMTIFHGIPLIKSGRKYWSEWRNWIYAPNVPAMRCESCRLVFFQYDNEEIESSRKEILASVIIGIALSICGLSLAGLALFIASYDLKGMYLLNPLLVILSLLILLPGLLFIKHAIAMKRPNDGI